MDNSSEGPSARQLSNAEIVYVLVSVESPIPTPMEEPSRPEDSPLILYAAIAAIVALLLIFALLGQRKLKRSRKFQTK
jgi:hypothetical protein